MLRSQAEKNFCQESKKIILLSRVAGFATVNINMKFFSPLV